MSSNKQFNIFIVDDNRIFMATLKAVIENEFGTTDFNVDLFEDGEACIERLMIIQPELVILDYYLNSKSLEAKDGLMILNGIKDKSPSTDVVMITSNKAIDVAIKSFHDGAIDYVIKNQNQFSNIIESIRSLLAKRQATYLDRKKVEENLQLMLADNESIYKEKAIEIRKAEMKIVNSERAEMERSKLETEEKNKNITDSINYAWRIQKARLPIKEEISEALPNSFVLFKPKDIVSGDFYFFHKTQERVFIVAADCTGHGVPGAFMSMIGSEKLSEAVSYSSDTSSILKYLNIGIKNSLHQSDSLESTRDGMDIAICSIDLSTKVVEYAGANRPFWYIKKDGTIVNEIKGTKKAIGGLTEDEQHFDSHEIQFEEGDTFYLTTDGYADQFGHKSGKKLMTKKFKEVLISIQDRSMFEQNNYLSNYIEDWRFGVEQLDDILVIGVRF